MPIHEYECPCCDHQLEAIQKAGEDKHRCPGCGGWMEKLVAFGSTFILKGEGWHDTDYPKKK